MEAPKSPSRRRGNKSPITIGKLQSPFAAPRIKYVTETIVGTFTLKISLIFVHKSPRKYLRQTVRSSSSCFLRNNDQYIYPARLDYYIYSTLHHRAGLGARRGERFPRLFESYCQIIITGANGICAANLRPVGRPAGGAPLFWKIVTIPALRVNR